MDEQALFGKDLYVGLDAPSPAFGAAGPHSPVDLQTAERAGIVPRRNDLATTTGRDNLAQALLLRLKTERGELGPLGYPRYGSQHHRLIGEPNSERNRNRIKLYVLECLGGEPRIERIESVDVDPRPLSDRRDTVKVTIRLLPRGQKDPLVLVVPFAFEATLP